MSVLAILALGIEYADCTSTKGYESPTKSLISRGWRPVIPKDGYLRVEDFSVPINSVLKISDLKCEVFRVILSLYFFFFFD